MTKTSIKGRFAPSPSGDMHLGNAWTALLAWLQVRQAGGTMVLRIEDLDPERSRPSYIAGIMADLNWLGLDWDEGPDRGGPNEPYLQSERTDLYNGVFENLKVRELIYPCFCSRADIRQAAQAPHDAGTGRYPGTCRKLTDEERHRRLAAGRPCSWRFLLEDIDVSFTDLLYGQQTANPFRNMGDFIVRRSDNVYAYQLAVVVDDALMGITHVLRGADLLHVTFWQSILFNLWQWTLPQFTHVPLLYGPDGQRLAKRHSVVSLKNLRAKGFRPRQIIGWLAYWAGLVPEWEELAARDLIQLFDLRKLPPGPVRVDPVELGIYK